MKQAIKESHEKSAILMKWAKKQGYDAKIVVKQTSVNDDEIQHIGISIRTDYDGPYPDDTVYQLHEKIAAYARRNHLRFVPHPKQVAVRLYFSVREEEKNDRATNSRF